MEETKNKYANLLLEKFASYFDPITFKSKLLSFDLKKIQFCNEDTARIILRILKETNVKIKYSPQIMCGSRHNFYGGAAYDKFENVIKIDLTDDPFETLLHEVGHLIHHFYKDLEVYKQDLIKTLIDERDSQLTNEINDLTSDLRKKIEDKCGTGSYDNLFNNIIKHSEFLKLEKNRKSLPKKSLLRDEYYLKEKQLMKQFEESGYIEDILNKYVLIDLDDFGYVLNKQNNNIFSDILQSKIDTSVFLESSNHNPAYYFPEMVFKEFFANMFCYFLSKGKDKINIDEPLLVKYFPKSINIFNEMFNKFLIRIKDND